MSRQSSTTVGRGSYTCLALFFSPTERGTLRHGCGSTASRTRTRRVTTAGALQCWLSFTVGFARRIGGLHSQPRLVGVRTYSSCGCGRDFQLLVPWCWLLVTSSQCRTHVYSRRGYLWDQVIVPHARMEWAYKEYTDELDRLMVSSVSTNYYTCWFEKKLFIKLSNFLFGHVAGDLGALRGRGRTSFCGEQRV
jgi:hypothetical protein